LHGQLCFPAAAVPCIFSSKDSFFDGEVYSILEEEGDELEDPNPLSICEPVVYELKEGSVVVCAPLSGVPEMSVEDIRALRWRILPCQIVLFITIWSSIFLGTFFSYVKTSGTLDIATVIYFTRLLSDTVARPAAQFCRFSWMRSAFWLNVVAAVRFLSMAVFFLYVLEVLPQSNTFITIYVAVFAFFSGFLSVLAYQLSQELCGESAAAKDMSAKWMNVTFQSATFAASCLSLALSYLLP